MISKAKKLILSILFIYTSFLVSQEELKIEKSYIDYFEPLRESIFIHTNKTTFLTNEEVWFRVYTYDRKNNLTSKKTSNIYVGLYNNKGKQIEKKLFLGKNGMASGNLFIQENLPSGEYYIKASTNWMKNFKEDDSFIQKIIIINSTSNNLEENDNLTSREYDFQFLPEGGNMLYGVKNNIGFKSINNNGKGIFTKGNITNSKNIIITTFESNSLGIGKFSFTPIKGETYKANLIIENYKKLSLELPKINDFGIILNLNNLKSKEVIIGLNTNDKSFKKIGGKNFKILVSKDGSLKSFLVKLNIKQKQIAIQRDSLFFGTNTLTIFSAEGKPLLERLFFNGEINKEPKLNIEYVNIDLDSINFLIENKVLEGKYLSASVSILPENTISYKPNHSIYSAFYLKPYVKGNIENPKYYFENFNRKKAYELDLLLLTQGWSRYSWDNIFNNDFIPYFEFEDGITINGSINSKLDKIESLLLYPNSYNNSRFISFDKNGKFTLKNYYPVYGEDFKLSIIDKKGNTKPPLLAVNSISYLKKDSINVKFQTKKTQRKEISNSIPLNFLDGESELLDEVVVSSRLNRVFKKKGPPFHGKIIKINDTIVKRYITLSEILNQQRFIVNYGSNITISSLDKRPVFFYLDGNLVPNMHNFLNSITSKYEDVYIDYSYNTALVKGRNYPESILVNVFSRRTPFKNSNLNSYPYKNVKLKYTYEPKKEFYSPKYIDFSIKAFDEYGVLHWYPDIKLLKNTSKKLTFLNTGAKSYNLFFEGISEKGELISIHKVLAIK